MPIHITKTGSLNHHQYRTGGATDGQLQPLSQRLRRPQLIASADWHRSTWRAGSYYERIVPLFTKSWFLVALRPRVLSSCWLCSFLGYRRQNMEKHPEIEQQKTERDCCWINDLKKIEQAQAARRWSHPFFLLSKTAIQNQLGLLWNIEPAALSLADIKNRLTDNAQLLEIFQAADEAAYGGASPYRKKMQEYIITLKTELEELL